MAPKILHCSLLALAAGAMAATVAGAAEVYQWTDDNGRTVFSSTAPKDRPASKAAIKVSPAKPVQPRGLAAAPTGAKKAGDAPGEAPQSERPDPALAAQNCSEARRVLQVLETTPRPRFTDTDGQVKFMDEEQKAGRRAEARRRVEENCP